MVILGKVLRQFWCNKTFLQVLITSYTRGEESSTHLALTDRGREAGDTLTMMQFFFISYNMGKDSTCLDWKDAYMQAFLINTHTRGESSNRLTHSQEQRKPG